MTPRGGYREGAGRKPAPWPTQLIKIKCSDEELQRILALSTRERAMAMLEKENQMPHTGYAKKRMTKTELDQFVKSADSVTTLQSDFGQWGAIIHKDGQDYEAWTDALDPEGDAMVEPISRDEAERAIIKDHRTVLR